MELVEAFGKKKRVYAFGPNSPRYGVKECRMEAKILTLGLVITNTMK